MTRGFLVAVAGAAIVVAGLTGCSNDTSSTSSSPRSSASNGSPNASGPSWNIVVNGQALAQGDFGNIVTCGRGGTIHISIGRGTGTYANLTEGNLEVLQISIRADDGVSYLLDPKQTVYHWGFGDAQVTNSGKTFTITGHIAPYENAKGQTLKDATPVPFEFDATCP